MAAASIGQVHRAVLPNGRRVAVKVQRPGAPRQIEADLSLLHQAARIAKERVRALDFIDTQELVEEFARAIRQELDYRLEARNAEPSGATSPATRTCEGPARLLDLHSHAGAHARVPGRDAGGRRRRAAAHPGAASAAGLSDDRSLDDDDLPARVLPRRPASGEHPRAHRRIRSAWSTSASPAADRRGHLEVNAALHRRREREHRSPAQAAGRPGVRYPGSARSSSWPSCANSSTATTARGCRRSIPCRSSARASPLLPPAAEAADPVLLLDRSIATLGSVNRALPRLQRLRGRQAVRAQSDVGRFTPPRLAAGDT